MMAGEFDQADRYLSGFISLRGDDVNSVKMFLEIRQQKYLEALDRYVFLDQFKSFGLLFLFLDFW